MKLIGQITLLIVIRTTSYLYNINKISQITQDVSRLHRTQQNSDLLVKHFNNRFDFEKKFIRLQKENRTWHRLIILLSGSKFVRLSLWRHLKYNVKYHAQSSTLDDWKIAIEREVIAIGLDILKKTIESYEFRLRQSFISNGNHYENLLYWSF